MIDSPAAASNNAAPLAKSPPPISAKLIELLESLNRQRDHHMMLMLAVIRDEVPAYGAIANPELAAEVRSMILINLDIWDRVLREQRPPSELDLEPVKAFARRRYHQGIPLTALLHSFRSGVSAIWREVLHTLGDDPDIQKEILMNISPYLLQHSDMLGQTLSHSYLDEAHRRRRWRDRRHYELCSLVLDNPEDQERFEQLAGELQVDPYGRRAALVVEPLGEPDIENGGYSFDELMEGVMKHLKLEQEPPHISRHGKLLLWISLAHGTNPVQQEQRLVADCSQLAGELSAQVSSIGVGLFRSEAAGWRTSAEQALSALEWGRRRALREPLQIHCYSDAVLEDCVVTQRFDAGYFEGLLGLLTDDSILIETLQVWLDTPGLTRKSAAGVLGIHPNTLDYRLRKIEQRLGANLSDLSWLARLHVALRLRVWH